ncbi:MAG: hypothetical protein V1792_15050 [Pseudomonadota bacterium]
MRSGETSEMRSNLPLKVATWLILLSAATVLVLGIGGGLPNAKRSELLTWGRPLTAEQSLMLRQFRDASQDGRTLDELCGGNKLELPKPAKGLPEALRGPTYFAQECLIFDLRRFIVSSSAMDEFLSYSILADMKPARLDFNPRGQFAYGNAYVFPLGALLFIMKSLGIVQVTRDVTQYLEHPGSIEAMYMAGRSIGIISFLAILFLLNMMGKRIGGAVCGPAAMLTFAFSTLPFGHSLISKPHLYAAFWVLLTFYFGFRFMETGSRKTIVLAVLTAGWAAASVLPAAAAVLLFPVALFDRRSVKRSLAGVFQACAGVLAVFLLVNPYTIIDFQAFSGQMGGFATKGGKVLETFSPMEVIRYLATLFQKSYCFPAALFALFGLAAALVTAKRPLRRVAVVTLVLMIGSSCIISATLAFPRYTLFVGTLICLLAGYGISLIYDRLRKRYALLGSVFLIAIFLPGACFTGLLSSDIIDNQAWYAPTKEWVRSIPTGRRATVGVLARLSPVYSPPFPFIHMTVLNLNRWEDDQPVPDYVLIGKYPEDRILWERHPLRDRFELAFNLGYRESYEWFTRFREENPSSTYGWVYVLKDKDRR